MRESETLELKKSTSELKEAIISIVSILNKHQKGELYFGVDRDGKVVGQTVTENTLREVSRAISEHIEPKIFPKVNEVVIEGKHCVHVEFSGNNVPYYAQGRAHMRVGDEDRQMSAKELEWLILQKNQERMKWDKEICKEAKMSDISTQRLKWFLKKAGKRFDTVENSLKKLGLLSQGKLLNTAVILFGRNPEKFFPNAKLRCAVFGETKAVTIDMQEYVGDLFTLIEKAEKYILENIHVGMRLEGMYRVDVPEIDKEAFREAVINAFCHRDYYLYDSVNIAIFKNKLEIRSPGLLYGGLTVEKIKTKEISERRNELLAEMFHQVHFIEKWGRGIGLILSKEPDTNFEEVGRQFVVTFKRKGVSGAVGVNEGVSEGVFEGVNSLLESIRKNPGKRVPQLAKILSIPAKTIERWIKQLKEEEKIEFRGSPKKGGYWVR
ncbi:putative DNA binding domain-containing protein [Candidatus Woesearchaeota archaeon]|nr:putative DNA binding domain-containing protein [Candidatus Woesearchaeota archaeon]